MHRAAGGDSPGSPRTPQLEALSRRLNAEVEQLRAENARLSVRATGGRLYLGSLQDTAGRLVVVVQRNSHTCCMLAHAKLARATCQKHHVYCLLLADQCSTVVVTASCLQHFLKPVAQTVVPHLDMLLCHTLLAHSMWVVRSGCHCLWPIAGRQCGEDGG